MSIFDKLLLKADRFAKLAELELAPEEEVEPPTVREPGIPSNHAGFFEAFERLVGRNIGIKDYSNWLRSNESTAIYDKSLVATIPNYNWDYFHDFGGSFMEAILGYQGGAVLSLRIYKKPVKNGFIQKSILIPGSGTVPAVYVYIGDFTEASPVSKNVDKNLGHDFFIWEAFSKGFRRLDPTPLNFAKVAKFVADNKAKINSLRKSFTQQPVFLGKGADGAAFDVGPFVLKFFKDNVAYDAAQKAIHRLHSSPSTAKTEAMLYDVGVLGQFDSEDIYYYLIEKMKPVENLDPNGVLNIHLLNVIRSIAKALVLNDKTLTELKKNQETLSAPALEKRVAFITDTVVAQLAGSPAVSKLEETLAVLKKKDESLVLSPDWLRLLIEEISFKFLTDRVDLHTGNIGLNNQGEFRYFDPAYGGWKDWENKKDKIHLGNGERHPQQAQTGEFDDF